MADNGAGKMTGRLETLVGNFGSRAERREGLRRLHFDEGLADVATDVSLCLGVLPLIAEKLSSEAFCEELTNGFSIITSLICEAAQNTIGALEAERRAAADEMDGLRNAKAGAEQFLAGVAAEMGSSVNAIRDGVRELGRG